MPTNMQPAEISRRAQPSHVESASAYLPAEWRQALARGETLPDRTIGAALFADISGFTPLTEALTETLGLRRGAEELPRHLNRVYDALIAEVNRYGGSVVGFAGDAITCWFDDCRATCQVALQRAVACAFAMQETMRQFAAVPVPGRELVTLAVKVAVASGPARRFVVGDPAIQLVAVLAGATVMRMAAGEHLAGKGEVVVDEATAAALGQSLLLREWRADAATGARFAVVSGMQGEVEPAPWPPLAPDALAEEQVRPWVLPTIYERLAGGLGEFLTELRPAAALFLRFGGIDYDGDDAAGAKLDAYIRWAQEIIARFEGTLIQFSVSDRGSFLYAAFGAPIAHEDDAPRAVGAALVLRAPPAELAYIGPFHVGISQGTMRTGAYGGTTRRTYGVLGNHVNLAARLMQAAAAGQILVGEPIHRATYAGFIWEAMPPMRIKGKAQLVDTFLLHRPQTRPSIRLQEPAYSLPMVGRQAELQAIVGKLELALRGKGQIVGITAEAGMGKSRLAAEVIHLALQRNFVGYGGACQSSGVNASYLVWGLVFRALFDVDPHASLPEQIRSLESEIRNLAPERVRSLPLLGTVLGLPIPDNDFTAGLEAQYRKSALEALLVDCLKAAAREAGAAGGGLLLVLEDLHWLDPVSHDLLELAARAIVDLPVLILLAYRPPELARLQAPRVEKLPHFSMIRLGELSPAEMEMAIRAKLAQLCPARGGEAAATLIERVQARSQGNPFYVEELINYLHDRGIDLQDERALAKLDLPASLHSLILSRIDQLTARQQLTLKVASIIGRVFHFAHLHGYYVGFEEPGQVKRDLDEMRRLELTPLESPEPELTYLFKHIITREVAYENLPYATRANLHEAYARYLETVGAQGLAPLPLDALAYHYGLSENLSKKREYLQKAGEAAAGRYANVEAVDYFEQLLPLLTGPSEQADILLKLGAVLELVGRWDEAEVRYREALALAAGADVPRCQQILGHLAIMRSHYADAQTWLEQARAGWQALADRRGLSSTLAEMGFLVWRKGELAVAERYLEEGLALARELDDRRTMAFALNYLANVLQDQGANARALPLRRECLALRREMTDKHGLCIALDNFGLTVMPMGDYATARALFEESLAIRTEVGDRWGSQRSLNSLGMLASNEGDLTAAKKYHNECLQLALELQDRREITEQYYRLGTVVNMEGNRSAARQYFEEGLALSRELGDQGGVSTGLHNLGCVFLDEGDLSRAQALFGESLALGRELGWRFVIPYDLLGSAQAAADAAVRPEIHDLANQAARAARLAAAGETMVAAMGIVMDPEMRPMYERAIAAARAVLGEAAFAAAYAEGQAMTEEQAVAYALEA